MSFFRRFFGSRSRPAPEAKTALKSSQPEPSGGGTQPAKAHDQETSVSSPPQGTFYCDICNEPLDVQKTYLLTTSQVVLSAAYWEFFWRHYPDHAARAGERGEKLSSYAIERAGDLTHWGVCQRCVGLCTEQPAASARSFREQVRFDGGTLIAPLCGPPPDWKLAVAAAEDGWAKAFGSRPLKNLGGSILGASLAVYYKSCQRWNIERFSALRKAAEQGDAAAQSVLGCCYASGEGVEQDHAEAAKWWRKAAEQGDVGAQYSLGVCYAKGNGVAKDQPEAVEWFRKAAEQGHADAQCVLGDRFDEGEGVGQDHAEAVKWYRKAAEQGIAAAQNNLGACYVKGEGVGQDHSEAAKWWRKAAEQGVAIAQFNLGVCYAKGEGVGQDEREAVKWWRRAAKQGNALAQNELSARHDKGETVGQDPTEGAARLVCPKCKKVYQIGVDAGIVGMEDVYASFIAHGGTAVYAADLPGDADPYLVGAYPSASERDSVSHVATCQRIRDRLRFGGRPTWYCGACKAESGHYEFPSDF